MEKQNQTTKLKKESVKQWVSYTNALYMLCLSKDLKLNKAIDEHISAIIDLIPKAIDSKYK